MEEHPEAPEYIAGAPWFAPSNSRWLPMMELTDFA